MLYRQKLNKPKKVDFRRKLKNMQTIDSTSLIFVDQEHDERHDATRRDDNFDYFVKGLP